MQKADSSSLFDVLDAALQGGSSERLVARLRQITDLFLSKPNRPSEETVALSLLSSASPEIIKPLMNSSGDDGLLIPCAKLPPGSAPKPGHRKLEIDLSRLSKSNTQRLLRFGQVREVSARSA